MIAIPYITNSKIDLLERITDEKLPIKERIEAEERLEYIAHNPEDIKKIRHYMEEIVKR